MVYHGIHMTNHASAMDLVGLENADVVTFSVVFWLNHDLPVVCNYGIHVQIHNLALSHWKLSHMPNQGF